MSKLIYGIVFLIVVLLMMSHLLVAFSSTPWLMGLPFWLYWYMFLHALLIGVLILFIKNLKEE